MRSRSIKTLFVTLAAGLMTLGGCTHTDIEHGVFWRRVRPVDVEIGGQAPPAGARLAVDVRNSAGSVIVEVDDRLEAPVITAGLLRPSDLDEDDLPERDPGGIVDAGYEPAGAAGGASTLRVDVDLGGLYPTGTTVAVRVRIPRCDGVNVVNNGGPIVIIGTDGAVTAQSGTGTGDGGRIEFRTSRPLRDPVALVTTSGRISAVIDPGGSGLIELDTERGQVAFSSSYGVQTGVRPGLRSFRGTWNGGKTPFIARTGSGDVDVLVTPDAEMYSTADDWMALLFED